LGDSVRMFYVYSERQMLFKTADDSVVFLRLDVHASWLPCRVAARSSHIPSYT